MKLFNFIKLSVLTLVLGFSALFIASSVFAANPPVLSSISPNISYSNQGTSETTYPATFTGSDLTGVTTVKFYSFDTGSAALDPDVSITDLTPVDNSHFTATIHVPPATKHRLLDVTATTSTGGEGPYLYGGFIIGQFPSPNILGGPSSTSLRLSMYADAAGTVGIDGSIPAQEGQKIWYKIELIQESDTTFNYLGGQVSVQFPDKGIFHKVAGFGDLSDPTKRDIPEITPGHSFTAICPEAYIVTKDDLKGSNVLVATAAYGSQTDFTQLDGTNETVNGPTNKSARVQINIALNIENSPTPTPSIVTPTPTTPPSNPPSNPGGPGDNKSDNLGCSVNDCSGNKVAPAQQVLGASTVNLPVTGFGPRNSNSAKKNSSNVLLGLMLLDGVFVGSFAYILIRTKNIFSFKHEKNKQK